MFTDTLPNDPFDDDEQGAPVRVYRPKRERLRERQQQRQRQQEQQQADARQHSRQAPKRPDTYFCSPAVKAAFLYLLSDEAKSNALNSADKLTLLHIARRVGKGENSSYPGIRKLAEDMGVSRPTVEGAIRRLRSKGVIEVRSGKDTGKSNVYVLSFYTPKRDEDAALFMEWDA